MHEGMAIGLAQGQEPRQPRVAPAKEQPFVHPPAEGGANPTQRGAACRILVLDGEPDPRLAAMALAGGAHGYVSKKQRGQDVITAVRTVARGDTYPPPAITRQAVDEQRRLLSRGRRHGPLSELSQREQQVFELVVRGMSNQDVAGELGISIKTVETHRTHINRKLDVHSPAELVRVAAERGLIRARRRS